ncbi:hypothetical protein EAO71_32320 [Streptomyces sp. ms191]|uniref:RICIN domain-containing protein n=1 Tax=Streptomyces sp. ms191 TaxID=1827978 RepID=UPI0011CDD66D|nr:hypothetical protein [Streptomyces sp. ms191]TXS21153.1 hypothetical protein EAO71_32320 [Streptomyces sp. ms191]
MTERYRGGRRAPDPREAGDPAAFVARLQDLKDWSGLTYRELTAHAEALGQVLPRSTVANMLSRATLPREELLTSFVLACGVDPSSLESWLVVRKELAVRGAYGSGPEAAGTVPGRRAGPAAGEDGGGIEDTGADAADTDDDTDDAEISADAVAGAGDHADGALRWPAAPEPDPEPEPPRPGAGPRVRRTLVGLVAVTGLVLAAVSVVVALVRDGTPEPPPGRPRPTAPAAGDVRIRVIGSDLCLGERRGGRSGQVFQQECAGATTPLYSLKDLGADRWRIVSDHPDYGPGCSGIPSGGRIPDAALEDSECGDPTRVERFALEPLGTPVRGYRIVPVGSATAGVCVTVVGDRTAAWARLAQAPCRTDGRGQLFSFDRRNTSG